MLPRWRFLLVLTCLFLIIQVVTASHPRLIRRAEDDKTDAEAIVTATADTTENEKATTTEHDVSKTTAPSDEETGAPKSTGSVIITTTSEDSQSTGTSIIVTSTGAIDNSTLFNSK